MKAFAMSWLLAAGLLAQAAGARAADSPRQQQTMDFGWRFALGDPAGAQAAGFDDSKWQAVDLPHDWSIHLAFDKNAPAGRPGGYLPAGLGGGRESFRGPAFLRGRVVSEELPRPGFLQGQAGLGRVRRHPRARRGLDQRPLAGAAPLRLHERRVRHDAVPKVRG